MKHYFTDDEHLKLMRLWAEVRDYESHRHSDYTDGKLTKAREWSYHEKIAGLINMFGEDFLSICGRKKNGQRTIHASSN